MRRISKKETNLSKITFIKNIKILFEDDIKYFENKKLFK